MKSAFLFVMVVFAFGATLASASADILVVGVVHDQDGRAVAGAGVAGVDAAGKTVGRDRSAVDGTFAMDAAVRPVAVVVEADDADRTRIAMPAGDVPLTVVVRRHRAVDLVPGVADVAALPAGSPAALAEMVPYRVAFPSAVSDRWLARGRGVFTVEQLPFYRRADGGDATELLPSHAVGVYDVRDPLAAPWYGDRGGGGVLDARLFDRADALRATSRDASLVIGRNVNVLTATSWDADGTRRLGALRTAGTLGPLATTFVGLLGSSPGSHYAGFGADLRGATRTFDAHAHLGLTADRAMINATRDDGSVSDAAFDVSGRGPNALAVRARWRDERGILGIADAQHHDAAIVVGTARGNVVRATAAVALAYGDDHSYEQGTVRGTALLPSLSLDAPLGSGWSLHAGGSGSSLGTPGYAIARSSLGEVALAFTDRRRLRAELLAFTEGDLAPAATYRGVAAALGWEIAPRVSLRAWSLRDGDTLFTTQQTYPVPPYAAPTPPAFSVPRTFNRDVVWLTWDSPTRLDLLVRGHQVEGSVRIPLGERYALTAGSYVRPDATRAFAFGLVAR